MEGTVMNRTLIALTLAWSAAVFAGEELIPLDTAQARCEAAREQKLAPIRQQKIAQCKRGHNQPTAGCETYYSTYGNNSNHANGSAVRGRFYDLPACAAAQASDRQRSNRQNF